jgi:GNAT superfamily N-acetyltransferase
MGRAEVSIHPYRPQDEAAVLELLSASLGGGPAGKRAPDFFRWKHFRNPFGESFMLLGEVEGRLAGLRALMRWRFRAGDRYFRAVRAVDTATHPEHRGRGVFSALTLEALDALRGEVDFVFNTPNRASEAGYLKMGWRLVGRPSVSVRVRRPVRFVRGVRSLGRSEPLSAPRPAVEAETAAEALADEEAVQALLEAAGDGDPRLHTPRDVAFLRWRYADAPALDYRAVRLPGGGGLAGLALFRVRPRGRMWECAVADVIVPPGDRAAAARLLRGAARAAPVDHVTCLLAPGSAARRAAALRGFVRSRGPILVARPMRGDLAPDPTDLASWGVSLGDLEVF